MILQVAFLKLKIPLAFLYQAHLEVMSNVA